MGMLSYLKRTLFLKRTHRLPESGIRVLFVGSSVVFSNPLPVSMGMFFFWKLLLFLLSFVFLHRPPPPPADSSTAAVRSGPRVHGVAQGSEPAPGARLTTLVLYRPPNSVRA